MEVSVTMVACWLLGAQKDRLGCLMWIPRQCCEYLKDTKGEDYDDLVLCHINVYGLQDYSLIKANGSLKSFVQKNVTCLKATISCN